MTVEPYLFFNGRCEEAIEFYCEVLGAEVVLMMRFRDGPEPGFAPPGAQDKVMHATITVRGHQILMSDGTCSGETAFDGFSLSLQVGDFAEGKTLFDALARGGSVQMPFQAMFWTSGFGQVRDRFGMPWMVNVTDAQA